MKKNIEFKRISKELIEEGITIDLLNKVQSAGRLSPVMFQKGDEPVKIIRANDLFYWVLLEDGTYLKDANNQLMKFDLKECIIARARYWLLYSEKEIEMDVKRKNEAKDKEIQQEVERIKENIRKQVKELNDKYKDMLRYAKDEEASGLDSVLINLMKEDNPELFQHKKNAALQLLNENPEMPNFINKLNYHLENKEYDNLYMLLETKGSPLLLSVNYNNSTDMELLKRFFHKDKLDETIDLIKNKSHIENIAMFNVNRKYV